MMGLTISKKLIVVGSALALVTGGAAVAVAKGMHHEGGPMGHMCKDVDQKGAKLIENLDRTIKPTDAQKAEFDAFKTALTTAEAGLKASCPKEGEVVDRSPPGMLAAMEAHLNATLTAVKTVRPAADALYAKLDDKQRDALRWALPFGMGHHRGGDKEHGKRMDNAPKSVQ